MNVRRVLIDTNVFIALEESGRVLDDVHADMARLCRELHFDLYYHPAQYLDLARDTNEPRRKIQESRIKSYLSLVSPPEPTGFDLMQLDWRQSNENDRVDNLLLFSLYRGAVSYLVTEDRDMHRKAIRTGLSDRVFTAEDFLAYLLKEKNRRNVIATDCVRIQTCHLYEIPLEQGFFDSLRHEYGAVQFDKWYREKSEEGRKAWVIGERDHLAALCVFKEVSDGETIADDGERLPGKVLKLCTFKVASIGRKLGERLLFVAFRYAETNGFDYVYVQVNEAAQPDLVDLIQAFGFVRHGRYKKDVSHVKDMRAGVVQEEWTAIERLEYDIRHYPHVVDNEKVKKVLVPIRPDYHGRLFPDLERLDFLPGFLPEDSSEANAIKKAYICGSGFGQLEKGDLLFFYRSDDKKSVSCVGFVEDTLRSADADDLMPFVARRTVFLDDEIREKASGGEQLAILFRLVRYWEHGVTWNELKKAGLKGPIQSLRVMDNAIYEKLFKGRLTGYLMP